MVRTHTHTHAHTHTHTRTHTHSHTHTHTHGDTDTQDTHTHTLFTHTYAHTHTQSMQEMNVKRMERFSALVSQCAECNRRVFPVVNTCLDNVAQASAAVDPAKVGHFPVCLCRTLVRECCGLTWRGAGIYICMQALSILSTELYRNVLFSACARY